MAKRNGEKHFNDDGIVIFDGYDGSSFIGAIDDYPSKEDFLNEVKSLYQKRFEVDDVEVVHVAWRADYVFVSLYGVPCGWSIVEKGARGSFPCWKVKDGR